MDEKLFEQLKSTIEDVVTNKTFSFDIIKKISEMRDALEDAGREIKVLEKRLEDSQKEVNDYSHENEKLKTEVEGYQSREKVFSEKEKQQALNDLKLDHQTQRANEIKELFGIVFRNPIVKESVFYGESKSEYNPGSSNISGSKNLTKEIE